MRFDDSLETVLAADMSTPFGAQSAWRQLVDLIGRRRVPVDAKAIARLKAIRADVPPPVRAASARALAFANPPAALVRLFFDDEIAIAAPVLRVAKLRADEWIDMLPGMSPAARSVLRHRRDLPADVRRALEAFGGTDYRLTSSAVEDEAAPEPIAEAPRPPMPAQDADLAPMFETPVIPRRAVELEPFVLPELDAVPAGIAPDGVPDIVPFIEPASEPLVTPAAWHELHAEILPEAPAPVAIAAENEPVAPIAIDWTETLPADEPIAVTPEPVVVEEPVVADIVAPIAIDPAEQTLVEEPALADPMAVEPVADTAGLPEPDADLPQVAFVPPPASPFVSVGAVAMGLPVVAEALRRAEADAAEAATVAAPAELAPVVERTQSTDRAPQGPFQISELVARIDAYQRRRDDTPGVPLLRGDDDGQAALFDLEPVQAETFRFETDAAGIVRWIEGAARAPLIGLSLDMSATPAQSRVDGVAAGAFRRRAGFSDARLVVDGNSDAAGQWRITGVPAFDRETGRFTGYRGTARRPRADESAGPLRSPRSPAADALRQLVHELRTPTNAIAGFAEMIESQLLGPVPGAYREQAATIRSQTAGLLEAIDDIDMAARIESHALDLRSETVMLGEVLVRIAGDLRPLAVLRRTDVLIDPGPPDLAIAGDQRAVERLIGRLISTLVASGSPGERIAMAASRTANAQIALVIDRPRTLTAFGNDAILTIDAEAEAEAEGAPLLGTGFALRLARNLAAELGGTLSIDARSLTLALPAASIDAVEQASTI